MGRPRKIAIPEKYKTGTLKGTYIAKFIKDEYPGLKFSGKLEQIMIKFHEKILNKMLTEKYIYKAPCGFGDFAVGEEVNKRKYRFKIVTDPITGMKVKTLLPNNGMLKCFRLTWIKRTSKLKNRAIYALIQSDKTREVLGKYIQSINDDPLSPSFRGLPIIKMKYEDKTFDRRPSN